MTARGCGWNQVSASGRIPPPRLTSIPASLRNCVCSPTPSFSPPRQGGGERYDAPRWSRARKKGSIVMCKGGGSSSTIDPAIKNLLTQNVASARAVANRPYQPYMGPLTADLTPAQYQ